MKTPEPELKPCPFCGGKAFVAYINGEFAVECVDCECGTRYGKQDEAVAAWNRRVELSKPDKLAVADEVYGWWVRYKGNPIKAKEPRMAFGTWLQHVIDKMKKEAHNRKEKRDEDA